MTNGTSTTAKTVLASEHKRLIEMTNFGSEPCLRLFHSLWKYVWTIYILYSFCIHKVRNSGIFLRNANFSPWCVFESLAFRSRCAEKPHVFGWIFNANAHNLHAIEWNITTDSRNGNDSNNNHHNNSKWP